MMIQSDFHIFQGGRYTISSYSIYGVYQLGTGGLTLYLKPSRRSSAPNLPFF